LCFLIQPYTLVSLKLAREQAKTRRLRRDGDAEDTPRTRTAPERQELEECDYVLYWMQSSQRAEYNHALEYAVQQANDHGQRLLVVFGLTRVCPSSYNTLD
jgi:hypothetical protein